MSLEIAPWKIDIETWRLKKSNKWMKKQIKKEKLQSNKGRKGMLGVITGEA